MKWRSLRALQCLLRQTARFENTSEEMARSHWYYTKHTHTQKHPLILNTVSHFCGMNFVCFQDLNVTQYHIIIKETLKDGDLVDGLYKDTMLGFSYQLGIFRQEKKVNQC